MELRHKNHETAIDLTRHATSEPTVEVRRWATADEPAQIKLHRSLKLWCSYADLMETHGDPDSSFAMYERGYTICGSRTRSGCTRGASSPSSTHTSGLYERPT
jgi:hypothetical protein